MSLSFQQVDYNHGSELGKALGGGLGAGIGAHFQEKNDLSKQVKQSRLAQELQRENASMKSRMIDDVTNDPKWSSLPPEQQMLALHKVDSFFPGTESIAAKYADVSKKKGNPQEDAKAFNYVKKHLGEEAAELWSAASEGGRTEIVKRGLEAAQRDTNLGKQLRGGIEGEEQPTAPTQQASTVPSGEQQPQKYPKLPRETGLTGKERVGREDKREAANLPRYEESRGHLHNLQSQNDKMEVLDVLNNKPKTETGGLPEGLGKLILDDKGGIRPTAQLLDLANTDTQEFAKTMHDFTTEAKDSYGSRVTNFDLQQFMQRLPTLLNTTEGRDRIIRQMKVINQMKMIAEEELKDTFEHYGLNKLSYAQATQIADRNVKGKLEELRGELKKVASGEYDQSNQQGNTVTVLKDGVSYTIPRENLQDALQAGASEQ